MSPGGRDRPPEGPGPGGIDRVSRLRDLGDMPPVAIGTRIFVEEDAHLYIAVGSTTAEIAERLGWVQENVWLPEPVEKRIQLKHRVIRNSVAAAAFVLGNPSGVHQGRHPDEWYFIIDAGIIRDEGLLQSSSTRYVDAVVELRSAHGGAYLRVFHLSPRKKNHGGIHLWP